MLSLMLSRPGCCVSTSAEDFTFNSPNMLSFACTECLVPGLLCSLCIHRVIPPVHRCSLREKLARALALLRTYQSRLRAAHASATAAPPPPPPPEAHGAADAPLAGAVPALPAARGALAELRSVPVGRCPACCQPVAGAPGRLGAEGGVAERVRINSNPAVAPAPPHALADLAASLLAWQLRRGSGTTLEGLTPALGGSGSAQEPAAASTNAASQSGAGGASGGRALRFDPSSGRSGAFVYEAAGGPTGSQEASMSAEAARAPARAEEFEAGSGPGQHIGVGTASWGPSARQAAGPAVPASGNAGAPDAAHGSGAGAVAADRHGDIYGQGMCSAVGVGAGGEVLHRAGRSAAGPLADRAPAAAPAVLAVAEQHSGPGVKGCLAVDEVAQWQQRAHAAHAHGGPEAATCAEAVRMQPGEAARMSAPAR